MFGVDTQSDVSTCLPCNLSAVRTVDPVTVNHLSCSTVLQTVGTLQFDDCPALDVFSVPASQLPPDMVGILGMPDILRLGISLDRCLNRPCCSLSYARALPDSAPAPSQDRVAYFDPDRGIWTDRPPAPDSAPAPVFSTDVVDAPPTSKNPFSLFAALLLFMFALVLRPAMSRHSPGRALLPGNSLGHSLFDEPPFASRSDVAWAALTDPPTPHCEPADLCQTETTSPCRDPPEVGRGVSLV